MAKIQSRFNDHFVEIQQYKPRFTEQNHHWILVLLVNLFTLDWILYECRGSRAFRFYVPKMSLDSLLSHSLVTWSLNSAKSAKSTQAQRSHNSRTARAKEIGGLINQSSGIETSILDNFRHEGPDFWAGGGINLHPEEKTWERWSPHCILAIRIY